MWEPRPYFPVPRKCLVLKEKCFERQRRRKKRGAIKLLLEKHKTKRTKFPDPLAPGWPIFMNCLQYGKCTPKVETIAETVTEQDSYPFFLSQKAGF
jgi:hypothetical protein